MMEALDRIETRLVAISHALETHVVEAASRFNAIDARFEKVFTILGEHSAHLFAIERRLSTIEIVLEDVRDDLSAGLRAIDFDAERVVDHEQRISRLEAHTGIS